MAYEQTLTGVKKKKASNSRILYLLYLAYNTETLTTGQVTSTIS